MHVESRWPRFDFSAFILSLVLLLSGCGTTIIPLAGSDSPQAAPTVGLQASPASITAGSQSTLTVTAANATQVSLTGSDGSSYSLPATGGTQAVTPGATTTYTAIAVSSGGKTSATATVTVTPAVSAPAVTLAASPASILSGSSSTLTVAATGASTVTLSGSDGSRYSLPAAGGTQVVSPSATTTYTATASGAGGESSAKTTVTVTAPPPAPTISISADPVSITVGGSSTLTVTAANASAVTVSGSDGSSYTLSATGGALTVNPANTTTYTATAASGNAKATAAATVAVSAPASTAWVYVVTSPKVKGGDPTIPASIVVYSADAEGRLTLVQNAAHPDSEHVAGVSGNYLLTLDSTSIHTYALGLNGAVGGQVAQTNTQNYGGARCGAVTGNAVLDRTGQYLTAELYTPVDSASSCDAWQTYQISSGGQLTFLGAAEDDGQYYLSSRLFISVVSGNNEYAYGIGPISPDSSRTELTNLRRSPAGDLEVTPTSGSNASVTDQEGNYYQPDILAADPSHFLAMVMASPDSNNPRKWLCSFTIDNATGSITTYNTWANMGKLTLTNPDTIAISPSSPFAAVGGSTDGSATVTSGLQLFYFDGATPPIPDWTLLPNVSVTQVAWDSHDHLYVIGQSSGQFFLHVYTVTSTGTTEAAGSPWKVPNAASLVVVPKP